ncbi:nucleoside deaminase [Anaeroselena agilis]|uniref:Nucleoside deaminase n=1 Tax=Anaeroselena agilis TaxID=3063788 RepID=A0ABU3P5M5_9FIRM|nr:nucleoside deaminase [Selenomonadales bacterium 4137-cl]
MKLWLLSALVALLCVAAVPSSAEAAAAGEDEFMQTAIDEAVNGVGKGEGGPFGAVIVKDGKILVRAHNQVLLTHDPTAHAEVQAIRKASALLGRFDLSDCVLYASCEPCPMCLGAIHWAKLRKVVYGATRYDAANAGFDDSYIYEVIQGKAKVLQVAMEHRPGSGDDRPFALWKQKTDKTQY